MSTRKAHLWWANIFAPDPERKSISNSSDRMAFSSSSTLHFTDLVPETNLVSQTLSESCQTCVSSTWSMLGIHGNTVMLLALSNISPERERIVGENGELDVDEHAVPSGKELVYHGCNPFCLRSILMDGLKPSKRKGDFFAANGSIFHFLTL